MWELKDEDIRPILFDRYESSNERIRFFEELCVGKTRTDAVLVCDKLIGFEIKSDRDSLERLQRQVKDYNRFFDLNYVVVGTRYLEKVKTVIPPCWGIFHVYLDEENMLLLELEREATKNDKVRLTNQYGMLWKSELMAIIKRNHIRGYSQKNKMKLKHLIMDQLPEQQAKAELLEELMQRDYTIWEE